MAKSPNNNANPNNHKFLVNQTSEVSQIMVWLKHGNVEETQYPLAENLKDFEK